MHYKKKEFIRDSNKGYTFISYLFSVVTSFGAAGGVGGASG